MWYIASGFFSAAIALTVYTVLRIRMIRYLIEHGKTLEAKIEDRWMEREMHYMVRYCYTVDGRLYRKKEAYNPGQICKEDNTVTILYDPRKPKRAVIDMYDDVDDN